MPESNIAEPTHEKSSPPSRLAVVISGAVPAAISSCVHDKPGPGHQEGEYLTRQENSVVLPLVAL